MAADEIETDAEVVALEASGRELALDLLGPPLPRRVLGPQLEDLGLRLISLLLVLLNGGQEGKVGCLDLREPRLEGRVRGRLGVDRALELSVLRLEVLERLTCITGA